MNCVVVSINDNTLQMTFGQHKFELHMSINTQIWINILEKILEMYNYLKKKIFFSLAYFIVRTHISMC